MNRRVLTYLVPLAIFVLIATNLPAEISGSKEGLALAIVYDTSGSMNESVRDSHGGKAPKYVIANRALSAIVDHLQAYAAGGPKESPRKVETGIFIFGKNSSVVAVPF